MAIQIRVMSVNDLFEIQFQDKEQWKTLMVLTDEEAMTLSYALQDCVHDYMVEWAKRLDPFKRTYEPKMSNN